MLPAEGGPIWSSDDLLPAQEGETAVLRAKHVEHPPLILGYPLEQRRQKAPNPTSLGQNGASFLVAALMISLIKVAPKPDPDDEQALSEAVGA